MASLQKFLPLLVLVPTTVFASPSHGGGGSGGGGGRLGGVAHGIGQSVGSDQPGGNRGSGGGNSGTNGDGYVSDGPCYDYGTWIECRGVRYDRRFDGRYMTLADSEGHVLRRYVPTPEPADDPAVVDAFLGVEDTYQSDQSASLMVSITDSRLRLAGSLTRYWEGQNDGSKLTLTMPTIELGVGTTSFGGTKVFAQAGVAYVKTANDVMPEDNNSITGGTLGLHVETPIVPEWKFVGDVRAMAFQHDIKAWDARVGVRAHHMEAAFRYLDFDVGPALFGPEVGIAF
ncbi:MAG TPA: hypothetical protein VGM90_41125 [Kofleriaceae bacterium]|jgi:hypothetical protein